MKIKVRKLLTIQESMKKLVSLDIPIKTAFKISKAIKEFNTAYTAFDESRQKLFKKYGEVNKDENLEIKKENILKFQKEIDDLMNVDIKITLPKITLEELGDIKIPAIDIANLDILVKE